MATLVGRECWWGGSVLRHGKVIEDGEFFAMVQEKNCCKGALPISVPKICLVFDRPSALKICQDAERYWQLEREKLEKEIKEGQE